MKNKLVFAVWMMCLLSACTEPWSIDLDQVQPRLVITGALGTEPGLYEISVTRAVNYFSPETELGVSGAVVTIDGVELTENPESPGRYQTVADFAAESGHEYRLEVRLDFDGDGEDELYTATAVAPQTVPLGAFSLMPVLDDPNRYFPLSAVIYFIDPVGDNYYGARMHYIVGDSLSQWRKVNYSDSPDKCVFNLFDSRVEDGSLIAYPCFMFGRRVTLAPGDTLMLFPTDTVELELNNYSPDYYEFVRQLREAASGQNPLFMTPVGHYTGNISGGALGAFGVYTASSRRLPILYKNRTWTNKELRERFGERALELYPDNEDPE
ncbi:MAG: DUF4249 domain-containing protein [Paludibacteraceae bacterium]|nr:DUF4249 domain-containing protein [Paludibacteraceae bacterium]